MSTDRRSGMTRRQALVLAGAGAVSAGVGVTGLLRGAAWTGDGTNVAGTRGRPELTEPEVLASDGGGLHVFLTAAAGRVALAGRSVRALAYNGSVPGPTLRLRAGDRVRLDLQNRLGAPTNLHVHGLHVSPLGNGDNAFVHVGDGETFRYEHQIPADHPAGTFWYHPHLHGLVADQVWGGLAGAIVVERDDEVSLPVQRERLLVVTDVTLDRDAVAAVGFPDRMVGREGDLVLVNGQHQASVTVSPGGYERWRLVNACSARSLRLRLDGGEMVQVGADGGRLAEPRPVRELLLVTGNRAELLVRLPEPGTYELVSELVDRGTVGNGPMMGGRRTAGDRPVPLLRVRATGTVAPAPLLPHRLHDLPDLRGLQVAATRTVTLAMGMGGGMGPGMAFTIDGRPFDPARVDTRVKVGTVEEWTFANESPMDHPLHLHVWPMQLLARGGETVEGSPQWLDVVNVPARGNVTVRVRFSDFDGRAVYHCHILDHEDQGMMAVAEAQR